jgi:hypothetical protein
VTVPQSALWQRIRQRALDAIPTGSSINFRSPLTLAAWQARGTYTIAAASSKKFTIVVAPSDFGGALISDAAFHLDHALEHQASLMNAVLGDRWSSPAWQVVTFYYWSYFSAMALSRLLGKSVWFVTPTVAQQFSALTTTGSPQVTKGTYELSCGNSLGAESRNVDLSKKQRRLHEQLWSTMFGLVSSVYQEVGAGVATAQEERLFLAIINSARVLGDDWPSTLRNLVNYRPGFAYTAPRFRSCVDAFTYLSSQQQSIEGVVGRLESNIIAMRADPSVESQPKLAAKMLADLTVLIDRMAHSLHEEIVERTGLDRRWLASKRRFAHQQRMTSTGEPWPF